MFGRWGRRRNITTHRTSHPLFDTLRQGVLCRHCTRCLLYTSPSPRDGLIVSIKLEWEVICALSNGYVADDIGWPLSTLNHLIFYILHCLMHLRNCWTDRKDSKCAVEVECASHSLQTTNWRGYGHVTGLKFCRLSWCSACAGLSATAELLVEISIAINN